MNEQELNKKLAEWAGFFYDEGAEYIGGGGNNNQLMHGLWFAPDNSNIGTPYPPPFTKSLDACFERLVPKLPDPRRLLFNIPHSINSQVPETITKGWIVDLEHGGYAYLGADCNPALALCLAIERLIDLGRK